MRSSLFLVTTLVLCTSCILLLCGTLESLLMINQVAVRIAKEATSTSRSESASLSGQWLNLISIETAEHSGLVRLIAIHLLNQGLDAEAARLLEKADLQDPISLLRQGDAYSRLGLHDRAISTWRQAKAEFYFLEQGHQSYETLDYESACTNYLRAVEIAPDMALAHMYVGHCFLRRSELDRAEQEYRQAMLLDPAYGYPYIHLAQLLNTSLQRSREAQDVLDSCLQHASRDWQAECLKVKQVGFNQAP